MSDEVDVESARLERLNEQKKQRIEELMFVDVHAKDVHVQTTPKIIFRKVKKNEG